jgi:hypothetical protein
MWDLERVLSDAHAETGRMLLRAKAPQTASERGRVAELAYAATAGLAVWSAVPSYIRRELHGGGLVTTRDRGVDAVGIRNGRLVLAQVKWFRDGACVSGDADMKLVLIAAVAQQRLALVEPPHTILVVRRGARTARTSPGTGCIELLELTDADIGLQNIGLRPCRPSGGPFDAYRYREKTPCNPNLILSRYFHKA